MFTVSHMFTVSDWIMSSVLLFCSVFAHLFRFTAGRFQSHMGCRYHALTTSKSQWVDILRQKNQLWTRYDIVGPSQSLPQLATGSWRCLDVSWWCPTHLVLRGCLTLWAPSSSHFLFAMGCLRSCCSFIVLLVAVLVGCLQIIEKPHLGIIWNQR